MSRPSHRAGAGRCIRNPRVVAKQPACKIAAVEFLEADETWSATLGDAAHDAFGASEARRTEGEHTLFEAAKAPRDAVATTRLAARDAIATAVQAATTTILQALVAANDGNQETSENGAVHAGADLE